MRKIKRSCLEQRGCSFCLDRIAPVVKSKYTTSSMCPHNVCPYHELDSVDTYTDYLNSISDLPVGELLKRLCISTAET